MFLREIHFTVAVNGLLFLAIAGGCDTSNTNPGQLIVNDDQIATQHPGDLFAWPADTKLTSLDECVIALPAGILNRNDPIDTVIDGDDDMGFNMPEGDDRIYLRLLPNMSVTIRKSCQALIIGEDNKPRRLKVHSQ